MSYGHRNLGSQMLASERPMEKIGSDFSEENKILGLSCIPSNQIHDMCIGRCKSCHFMLFPDMIAAGLSFSFAESISPRYWAIEGGCIEVNGTDFSHKSPLIHSSKGFRWDFINDIAASVEEQESGA